MFTNITAANKLLTASQTIQKDLVLACQSESNSMGQSCTLRVLLLTAEQNQIFIFIITFFYIGAVIIQP